MSSHYLIIAGPIGVGKSTLTAQMQQYAGYLPLFEEPDQNPYLKDFYASKRQWGAFETQLAFLGQRLQQCRKVADLIAQEQRVVQDRSIYEDCHIFATHHYQQGLISEREFQTYRYLYAGMVDFLPAPDMIIYLSAPVDVLLERIRQRGHDYEQNMSPLYLAELNELYGAWAESIRQVPFIEIDTADSQGPEDIFEQVLANLKLSAQELIKIS